MYNRYLITGATGFLGRAIVEELVRRNVRVDALVLRNDPYSTLLPEEVHTVIGDVCEDDSLEQFFACLLYTSPSPRDVEESRMPSSA